MANLTPSASFDAVPQLETSTFALAGPGAPMNLQAQALLNRTQYLYVQLSNLAPIATSGDYNSLLNRPTLGSAAYQPSSAFATAEQGAKADGAAQASSLSSVAFSGTYGDLNGKPFASDAPQDSNIWGRKSGSWAIVGGDNATLMSDLASTSTGKGAALVGYQLSGIAGSVARDLDDRALDRKSLFDFFTSAQKYDVRSNTGSIDLGATINTILANFSAAGGGVMEAPPGTYLTTTTIVVPSNVHFIGHGVASIIKASGVTNQVVLVGKTATPYATSARFSGFNITGTAAIGVEVGFCVASVVSDITLNGLNSTNGYYFHDTFGSSFGNLWSNGATISQNCFIAGTSFNANHAYNWYTSNFCACNILLDSQYNGASTASVNSCFSNMVVQGGNQGLWVKSILGASINGLYEENTSIPLMFGEWSPNQRTAKAVVVNGATLQGPLSSHPNFANRYAYVDFQNAYDCEIRGLYMGAPPMESSIAPITFSGGGGSGAKAVAILTAAGAVHDVVVTYGGTGYTSAPTATVGGIGSGATLTCTLSGSQVGSIAVTAGGSGYTATFGCPLVATYNRSFNCSISSPYWDAASGAGSAAYPYVKYTSGAPSTAGLSLFRDNSYINAGYASPADFRKTQGAAQRHAICEVSYTGSFVATLFTPVQYP